MPVPTHGVFDFPDLLANGEELTGFGPALEFERGAPQAWVASMGVQVASRVALRRLGLRAATM